MKRSKKERFDRNYTIFKVCQGIIINRIYNSIYSDNITTKGGIVMFHLTNSNIDTILGTIKDYLRNLEKISV